MKGTANLEVRGQVLISFRFKDCAGKAWALERLNWIVKHDILATMNWQIILILQPKLSEHAVREWKTNTDYNSTIKDTK